MNIEITTPQGKVQTVVVSQFPALDGWDIQQKFVEFAASRDSDFRKDYTLRVLTYAAIETGQNSTLPLATSALVDNHLCSWQNVQRVFEEILKQNGIDPATHADRPMYWSNAGAEMATAFIAEVSQIMGPALALVNKE